MILYGFFGLMAREEEGDSCSRVNVLVMLVLVPPGLPKICPLRSFCAIPSRK